MATYYVRPTNGNDGNAGTSFASAFQTTQKAADVAVAGDTVYLCAESVELITAKIDLDTNAGTILTPIVFVAANSSGTVDGTKYTIRANTTMTAVVDYTAACDYTKWIDVVFDGDNKASYPLYNNVDGSDAHVFVRCRFTKGTSHGVFVRGAAGVWTLIDCEIDRNGGAGVTHAAANRGPIAMYFGSIHHNTSYGWNVDRAVTISRVRIYRNGNHGVLMGNNSTATTIDGCVFYLNSGDGIQFQNNTARNGYIIYNNTFVANTGYGLRFQSGNSGVCWLADHNHTHGNVSGASDLTLPGFRNITGDPLFTSTTDGAEDFTPAANSPLVAAGFGGIQIGALPPAGGGGGVVAVPSGIGHLGLGVY